MDAVDPWDGLLAVPCGCDIEDGLVHQLCEEHEASMGGAEWIFRKGYDAEVEAVVCGKQMQYRRDVQRPVGVVADFRVNRGNRSG